MDIIAPHIGQIIPARVFQLKFITFVSWCIIVENEHGTNEKKILKINFHPDTMLTTIHKRGGETEEKKQFTRKVNKPFIKPFSPNRTNIILNDLPQRGWKYWGWGVATMMELKTVLYSLRLKFYFHSDDFFSRSLSWNVFPPPPATQNFIKLMIYSRDVRENGRFFGGRRERRGRVW